MYVGQRMTDSAYVVGSGGCNTITLLEWSIGSPHQLPLMFPLTDNQWRVAGTLYARGTDHMGTTYQVGLPVPFMIGNTRSHGPAHAWSVVEP